MTVQNMLREPLALSIMRYSGKNETEAQNRLIRCVLRALCLDPDEMCLLEADHSIKCTEQSTLLVMTGWTADNNEIRFLRNFRKQNSFNPAIIFGSSKDSQVRAAAFICGANNYVAPDSCKEEVVAKLRSLLDLKQFNVNCAPIKIEAIEIWPEEKIVTEHGHFVRLSERELELLLFLARQHPSPVSRRTLEAEVFGYRHDPGTNVVAVHMHRLRKRFPGHSTLFNSVPGGYKLG